MQCEHIQPRWHDGRIVVVVAPGPSLTSDVAERCRPYTCMAVKEAYRLLPHAEVLYGCDAKFWDRNDGCEDFKGEKWSSHGANGIDDKREVAVKYGLRLVQGIGKHGFSLNPNAIHYGGSSGFQAINLAILFGATYIVLVGFDMRVRDGRRYYFGDHPNRTRPAYADKHLEVELGSEAITAAHPHYECDPEERTNLLPHGEST
jgi:hypothetical protein